MLSLIACLACLASAQVSQSNVEQRVEDTLSKMTTTQKIDYISGGDGFYINPIPDLGVPRLKAADGPVGIRNDGPTTAYPATVGLAASFDTDLALRFGKAMARDARSRGVHIWYGPGVNLSRIPQNGRNFEYLGEDPYLASRMVVNVIKAAQAGGLVATVKHYALNNHEQDRGVDSSDIDERTLRELYLKPFEAAVKEGNVWSVMCAYNKINGVYCSENDFMQNQILKNEWGFKGMIVSDYGATHSTLGALKGGLDLEMPSGVWYNRKNIEPLLASGAISMSVIDDKVRRMLRVIYAMGFADHPQSDPTIAKDDDENRQTALDIARESLVLLENRSNYLPLKAEKLKRILLLGPNVNPPITGGGGSSYTEPATKIGLLEAFQSNVPNAKVDVYAMEANFVKSALGFKGYRLAPDSNESQLLEERWANKDFKGQPSESKKVAKIDIDYQKNVPLNFSIRWTGLVQFENSGEYLAIAKSDDGIRAFLNDKLILNNWGDHGEQIDTATIKVKKGQTYRLRVEYYQSAGLATAQFGFVQPQAEIEKLFPKKMVQGYDAVIASVGFNPNTETEGLDRSFSLPGFQNELIQYIAKIYPKVIVVNNSGAGVDMSGWNSKVGAIIQAWYPGGVGSLAVVEAILGLTNPSGKLPTTFPRSLKGTYYETAYPPKDHHMAYKEGLFIGYRWFDAHKAAPLYPFGYGLSYTEFKLSDPTVTLDPVTNTALIRVGVQNVGKRVGSEVVQVYGHVVNRKVVSPVRQLVGFGRVTLAPAMVETVNIPVKLKDLAYYDVATKSWVLEPGKIELSIGTSSRDLPLKLVVKVSK
jgi:beta-glucosidase